MAAVAEIQTVNITVNDTEIAVPKGELIVESVKRLGLEIPIFCYHPRMKPVGMCRMCLVEVGMKQPDGSVRKMPKPQAACTLPASEGLVIYTDTELIHKDRKGVLEFLLINHPLDCPICDRGGECPLQNNTMFYGPSTSRFVEMKRHLPKAYPLSKYVTLDLERCIQCGRCVRFTEEISGDSQLAFRFRGAAMQPSTFELREFESKFSGNVIEICPVGALTSSKYRFRARPWDLETKPAICTLCSNGCNIHMDYRGGQVVRINGRTNEAVNEEWTCDRGKFGHDFYNSADRLTRVLVRQGDQLVEAEWADAYSSILRAFANRSGNEIAALAGQAMSNEDYFLLSRLFRRTLKSNNLDHRWTRTLRKRSEHLANEVQTPIAEIENRARILVFGPSLADDEPIVFLRVRKAWFKNGAQVVVASDADTEADSFAHVVLRYRTGTAAHLAKGLAALVAEGANLNAATLTRVAGETGIAEDKLRSAVTILGQGATTVTAQSLLNEDDALGILGALSETAQATGGEFNCYSLMANTNGAQILGIIPDAEGSEGPDGLGTQGVLEACARGEVKALWLAGVDPFAHADRGLVTQALENVEFLVVQDIAKTEAFNYASIVLPMAAPAESDGTYTNAELRVQTLNRVFPAKGEAKAAWRTYSELSLRLKPETPLFNPAEVLERIRAEVPAMAALLS